MGPLCTKPCGSKDGKNTPCPSRHRAGVALGQPGPCNAQPLLTYTLLSHSNGIQLYKGEQVLA